MASLIQRAFAAGEIAPDLYSRVDTSRYATGLRTCKNFQVKKSGGAENRPGTEFVGQARGGVPFEDDNEEVVRLLPFVFNNDQTYILEFGHLYMAIIRNGAYVTSSALTITNISTSTEALVVTSGAHGLGITDVVYLDGIVGMTELNGRYFEIESISSTSFKLAHHSPDPTGVGYNYVDTTTFSAYVSGGTATPVYRIDTPYLHTDLRAIKFVQSADVITLTHPEYAPREVARLADDNWTISEITTTPSIARPVGVTATAGGGTANRYRYKVTAIAEETYEESLAGLSTNTNNITSISNANPAVVTYAGADNIVSGDTVYITGVVGMTQVNGREFEAANVNTGANTFELRGIDSTSYSAYVSGGTVNVASFSLLSDTPTASAPNVISWTLSAGAIEYNVYKKDRNGAYGFIGIADSTSFNDTGIDPDTSDAPPDVRFPFDEEDDYPAAVSYFQQRLIFANTNNEPEKVWGSRTGFFHNFSISSPIQDDDAITFTLAGRQVNAVKHLIELIKPIIFTTGGEWVVEGGTNGILSPGEINPKQHSYNGSGDLAPIITGGNAIYVQARGSIVRDLGFDFNIDGYRGNDLTTFSSHLIEGHELLDWTYQQTPNSIIWMVRDDGTMLGLTYVREQEILGWHRHEFTNGEVISVCAVPEGNEDAVYIAVRRTIDNGDGQTDSGESRIYIERLATRQIIDIEDAKFMDSTFTHDGRADWTVTGTPLSVDSGGWTNGDTLILAHAGNYSASDVGKQARITAADGTVIRLELLEVVSGTTMRVRPNRDVPTDLQSGTTTVYSIDTAITEVSGLWHLEGQDVSVFGDSYVVASPNNTSYEVLTVEDGMIELSEHYAYIHIGLPIVADVGTLDIDTPQGETIADKSKFLSKVSMHVTSSRGGFVGAGEPDDNGTSGLYEFKLRNTESYDDPPSLKTEVIDVIIRPEWNSNGRIFIRQIDPLPLSIGSIIPAGKFPFRGTGG